MDRNSRTYVAGHRGMVASALVRRPKVVGHARFIVRVHAELDLLAEFLYENLAISVLPASLHGTSRKLFVLTKLAAAGRCSRTSRRDGIANGCEAAPFAVARSVQTLTETAR